MSNSTRYVFRFVGYTLGIHVYTRQYICNLRRDTCLYQQIYHYILSILYNLYKSYIWKATLILSVWIKKMKKWSLWILFCYAMCVLKFAAFKGNVSGFEKERSCPRKRQAARMDIPLLFQSTFPSSQQKSFMFLAWYFITKEFAFNKREKQNWGYHWQIPILQCIAFVESFAFLFCLSSFATNIAFHF